MIDARSEQTGAVVSLSDAGGESGVPDREAAGEARLEILLSRYQSLLQELASAHNALKFERQKNEKLLAAVTRMQGENSAYRQLLDKPDTTHDEISELARKVGVMSEKIDGLHVADRGRSETAEAAEAVKALRLVTSSLSWRITRPLRAVRGLTIRRKGM